jgi:outer membrane protein OmpA-like peptidoglycan-associated protein
MTSMLDNLHSLVTPAILSRVTGQTGESESAVVKGFGAAIPAIAAMTATRSDDHGFVTQLADLAARTASSADSAGPSGGLAAAALGADTGAIAGWLSSLFGQNLSGVADSIARYAGIRGSTATSLLSVGSTLVLTALGRWMRRDNINATALADRLRGERAQLAGALPLGFELPSSIRASLKAVGPVAEETTPPIAAYVVPEPETTSWSVPLLLLLGGLGLGGLLWWGVRQHQEQLGAVIGEGTPTAVGTTGTISGEVMRTLPGNVNLRFPSGSIEDRLSAYLASAVKGSTGFTFDRIEFDTGSASLAPESREQLRKVAAILKAYPNADVTVVGHTDNVGNETANLALSRARAECVAKELTEAGVAQERVHTEGFGSQKPIADNATDAGRAQNRRAMLDVVVP